MIDGPPEIVRLAIDFYDHLVEMPSPPAGSHPLDAPLSDLGREHRTEPVPPEPHRLVADIDAPLMEQVLDVTKRQRETDVEHHRQADDLFARLEVLEGAWFRLTRTLQSALHRLKPSSFDSAP